MLLLERLETLDRCRPQQAGLIGRTRRGRVERREDIATSGMAPELGDHVRRYLLRGDELHLPECCDGLELVT